MKKLYSGLMTLAVLGGAALQTATIASAATGDAGSGEAKVTYNANAIDPEVGTDPDFAVLIPSAYQLSDNQGTSAGSIKMVDKDDYTKDYAGTAEIKVAIQSTNNFEFANGGKYLLSDDTNATVWDETKTEADAITFKTGEVSKVVNAKLTKKADKAKVNTPSSDKLTFNYTVQ